MRFKTIAILGAGERGKMFADLIAQSGHLARVVAVAEPRKAYQHAIITAHDIVPEFVFSDWRDFVRQPKMCDAVIIATPDREHHESAVACLNLGYDLLLEKPMGVTLDECRAIESAQRKSRRIVGVCHSLRYHKGFRRMKELVSSGAIGKIMTIDHLEQVEMLHQAHSFVRGNWASSSRATAFMLLAKSCHDLDYLSYLIAKPCLRVSSFGNLTFFRPQNAPPGATERCTDGCPHETTCTFSAIKQYVNTDREKWPANVAGADHSHDAHLTAIRTGPYGRCVWKCDNDAVDHQIVAMQFADDITATFTMTAFTAAGGRRIRIHGTLGELSFDEKSITLRQYQDRLPQVINIESETGGHGGGDARVLADWLTALHSRDESLVVANAQESLRSHAIAFAAEQSRLTQKTVDLQD